jgi:hypothetical protein
MQSPGWDGEARQYEADDPTAIIDRHGPADDRPGRPKRIVTDLSLALRGMREHAVMVAFPVAAVDTASTSGLRCR